MFAFFLSSGLFLGWSLGANDAANVFGTAVGSRMISFRKAATYCGIFVILGAVASGAGAARTLGELGAVNAIAGAFVVALAAGITVYWLTVLGYPVSTTQAIVGAIIGWNLFSGALIDFAALEKIVLSWVISPVLAAIFSAVLYRIIAYLVSHARISMFDLDALTRAGLLLAGIAGAYALGANNIANVVGIFVPISPFADISILGFLRFTAAQQLFFIGAVAIAVGTFTYGKRVMMTVGEGITEMSPVAALVAVLANALVLFLFASEDLEAILVASGLPAIPLVPVSSSQAIVGSVIGIALVRGGRGIRWRMLGEITGAWVMTPLAAIVISFIALFFLQNVFQQKTFLPVEYRLTVEAAEELRVKGISTERLAEMRGITYMSARDFRRAMSRLARFGERDENLILSLSEVSEILMTPTMLFRINDPSITGVQKRALERLVGRHFAHRWQWERALAEGTPEWRIRASDKEWNRELRRKLDYLFRVIRAGMQ
jgi:PiT family inorganic phosphate transporter